MQNLKNKINKQAKQKQTQRYRELIDGCQMGGRLGRMVEKSEGIKLVVLDQHGDVKFSIGK